MKSIKKFWLKIEYKIARRVIHRSLKNIEEMDAIQSSDGNWNYSPGMFGLANGIKLCKSVLTGENPNYLNPPKRWKYEQGNTPLDLSSASFQHSVAICRLTGNNTLLYGKRAKIRVKKNR